MVILRYYQRLEIPKRVWQLQIGAVLNAFGSGATLPYLMLYLNRERGFDVAVAGALTGMIALTGFVSIPFAGPLIDRFGPRRMLIAALGLLVLSFLGFIVVRAPWHAAVCTVVAGLGTSWLWPSNALLMASLLGPEKRHVAFAVERTAANIGAGVGAFLGGVLVALLGYTWLFVVDAASFAFYLTLVVRLAHLPTDHTSDVPAGADDKEHAVAKASTTTLSSTGRPTDAEEPQSTGQGHGPSAHDRTVRPPTATLPGLLREKALRRMILLKFVLVLAGFGPFEVLALFARDEVDVSTTLIGLIFLVNTAVIISIQIPLTSLLPGRRRMLALALVAVVWAITWAVVGFVGVTLTGVAAAVALMGAAALFGVGEALQAPAQDPVFIELAPEAAHGRAMALSAMAFQGALGLGPVIGGWLLDRSPSAVWVAGSLLALVAGGLALLWERSLPTAARLTKSAD